MGQHRFTWEVGPQISYPEYGLGIGGNLIAAVDEDGETQLGVKTRGFRHFGPVEFDLGVGVFFHDSRRLGELSFTFHAAASVVDVAQLVLSLDAIEHRLTGSESRIYVGTHVRYADAALQWPVVAGTIAVVIAVIAIRER